MFCESCKKRPATMRMTVRKADGESHMLMLCGMCAYRFTNVMQQQVPAQAAGASGHDHLPPELFHQTHFPTQRYGAFMGFSPSTQEVIKNAEKAARKLGLAYVGTFPLLIGIMGLAEHPAREILEKYGIKLDDLVKAAAPYWGPDTGGEPDENVQVTLSEDALRALEMAQHQARGSQDDFVEPQHVILGLLQLEEANVTTWMREREIDFNALEKDLAASLEKERSVTTITEATPEEVLFGADAQAQTTEPTESALAKYARDLTKLAEEGKLMPVVGRDAELGRSIRILSRMQKNNPLLLGEPGVGKTAIVEALAQHIVGGNVPRRLRNNRVYEVDLTAMVAGTEMRGEFEKRMKQLIDEVKAAGPNMMLFIDEIHTLVGAGASEGSMDAGNILKPALARGELHLIGATTLTEYRKYIEKDPALARRFQPVLVGEPTVEQAIAVLQGIKTKFEEHHGVDLSDEAISAAVTLSNQYLTDRFLPDKAIDLVDEACSAVAIDNDEKGAKRAVIADDVARVTSSWTGIPLTKMMEPEVKRLLNMEDILHKRIVNQEEAINIVSDVVRRARAGLKDPTKPNGSFVFAGPTGVGKTELARSLADFLFDNEDALIRLDMSEYMEKESVSRLIGAPPGYVGYEQGGQLTEKVRTRPYSVVLFDEMEKSNPQVLNLLLQIADAGCLTDGQGRRVDFKNTIIILTTNVGADLFYSRGRSMNRETLKERLMDMLISATSPELVNRMDAVVLFSQLTQEQVQNIISLQVGYLARRCADQGITLEVDPAAITLLAQKGYEPAMGARTAKRVIQDELVSPLSEMILAGTVGEDQKAKVAAEGDHLKISPG